MSGLKKVLEKLKSLLPKGQPKLEPIPVPVRNNGGRPMPGQNRFSSLSLSDSFRNSGTGLGPAGIVSSLLFKGPGFNQ